MKYHIAVNKHRLTNSLAPVISSHHECLCLAVGQLVSKRPSTDCVFWQTQPGTSSLNMKRTMIAPKTFYPFRQSAVCLFHGMRGCPECKDSARVFPVPWWGWGRRCAHVTALSLFVPWPLSHLRCSLLSHRWKSPSQWLCFSGFCPLPFKDLLLY